AGLPRAPVARRAIAVIPAVPRDQAAIAPMEQGAATTARDRGAAIPASPPPGPTTAGKRSATSSSRGKPAAGASGPGGSGRAAPASARVADRSPPAREADAQAAHARPEPPRSEDRSPPAPAAQPAS